MNTNVRILNLENVCKCFRSLVSYKEFIAENNQFSWIFVALKNRLYCQKTKFLNIENNRI